MDTAERLAARLDDLASSLARSGAPPVEAQRLLESASLATLQAVSLDLLTAARAGSIPNAHEHKAPVLAAPVPERLAA
ncbi:MAG: hypothetical protein ACXVZ2_08685 [Gaiellaceae bacterium]